MSVLQDKSVGNIFYQLIDDIFPVHSGSTGYVAISTNGEIFTCISGYVWTRYLQNNIFSEISNQGVEDRLPTVNVWGNFNAVGTTDTWGSGPQQSVGGNYPNFVLTGATGNATETIPFTSLILTGDTIGKFLVTSVVTTTNTNIRSTGNDIGPILNSSNPLWVYSVVPYRYHYANTGTVSSDAITITTPAIFTNVNSRTKDNFFMSYRNSYQEGTSRYNRQYNKLNVRLLEPPLIFKDYGDTYSFNTNGWTVVNDSTNKWVMGSGASFVYGTSIYVSNNNTTNTYTNTVSQVSHFYKDISFPKTMSSDLRLEFYWRCSGQTTNDYCVISLAPTSVTPVTGVTIDTNYNIGGRYSGINVYSAETITIPRVNVLGDTKRLIFSWVNDGSGGGNPPISIDSFRLYFYTGDDVYSVVTGDTENWSGGDFLSNNWTTVQDASSKWFISGAKRSAWSTFSGTTGNSFTAMVGNYTLPYVDKNPGLPATYTKNINDVSHFYKDFTFNNTATGLSMEFDWVCWGENAAGATQYDYGAVVITATTFTPVAGSEVSTSIATAGRNGRIGASSNLGKFNLGYGGADTSWRHETINLNSWSGQTKRIVFTWKDDTTGGVDPPMIINNIKITGVGDWAKTLIKIN